MHLITPLVSGIAGAENGTAYFYRRGAAGTYVTYYTSFEGDGATTPTAGVTLDANGGGVFYVNEETLCVVKNAAGTTVRSFVAGSAASSVEVISQSFTGTSYTSGQTGASKPLPLSTALDRLYTSFGARDFNVLVGGSSVSMQTALGQLGVLFFSVKDPTYGATGDGTTNDLSAIQACIDAADTAGGGVVFFPKGTYNIGFFPSLTVPDGVSLLGVGPGVSVIKKTIDAGNELLTYGAASDWQSVEGLSFTCAVPTTRQGIASTAASKILIRQCTFGDATNTVPGPNLSHGSSDIAMSECVFYPGTAGNALNTLGRGTVTQCKAVLPATYNGVVYAGPGGSIVGLRIRDCVFDSSGMSGGSGTLFSFSGFSTSVNSVVMGCICANPAGGTLTVSTGPGINSQGCNTYLEIGNDWGSLLVRSAVYGDQALTTTHTGSFVMERERARYYVSDDAAAISVSSMLYACATVARTTLGVQTVTLDGPGPVNHTFTLVYYNSNGGGATGNITMAGNVKGLTTFTVNASSFSTYIFKAVHVATTKFWVLAGSLTNQTP